MEQITAVLLIAAGTVLGGEKISYDQLRSMKSFEREATYWSFTVVTADGTRHRAQRLRFNADEVLLFRSDGGETVESSKIVRLEVGRRFGGWSHRSLDTLKAPILVGRMICGSDRTYIDSQAAECIMAVTAASTPVLVIASLFQPRWPGSALFHLAAAPVYLIHDAIDASTDATVYEIIH